MNISSPLLHPDLLILHQWISNQLLAIQIFLMHVDGGDLVVLVGGIVVDAFVCVAAGGIKGDFIAVVSYDAATTRLCHCAQDMKELVDAF